jgi:hypothetical protein
LIINKGHVFHEVYNYMYGFDWNFASYKDEKRNYKFHASNLLLGRSLHSQAGPEGQVLQAIQEVSLVS